MAAVLQSRGEEAGKRGLQRRLVDGVECYRSFALFPERKLCRSLCGRRAKRNKSRIRMMKLHVYASVCTSVCTSVYASVCVCAAQIFTVYL